MYHLGWVGYLSVTGLSENHGARKRTVFPLRRAKILLDQLVSWVHCDKALGE